MPSNPELVQAARALRLNKGFSQNFLVDDQALKAIADAVDVENPDTRILEIGCGAGFLTRHLLATGHPVVGIEVENKIAAYLNKTFAQQEKLTILHADALRIDWFPILEPRGVLTGNLPYHITGPLLFKLAGELADAVYPLRQVVEKAVFMVQKEVGERLTAKPGNKSYGQLTLQIGYWFTVEPVLVVPRTAFIPAPKVDSMVVKLTPRTEPAVAVKNLAHLSRLIKDSFKHRRKTLLNCLKISSYGDNDHLRAVLEQLGIDPNQRPETISMEQYGALSDALGA